jgi:hypothetical protein
MGRKLMLVAASLVMLAGCTAQNDGGGDADKTTEEATGPVAPKVVDGEPIEFELEAPSGFAAVEEDRAELVADSHVTYSFALDGGGESDRLTVTSYAIGETIPAGDFDSLVAVVAAYDGARGQANEATWYSHATVHRMPAVHRYIEVAGDTAVKQYNHYIAVDTHLIQITCQWETNYTAVMDACYQLEQDFPVPEGWEPQPLA